MTIPSRTWFPQRLQERAAWYQNFSSMISSIGASLGLTLLEIAAIGHDAEWMAFLADSALTADGYSGAIREYRNALTEGELGSPMATWPADIVLSPPATGVANGIFARLDAYVKRIRVSPNYTEAIGTELGIIPTKGEDIVETQMKPAIKTSALPGSIVDVQFTRGKADGIVIETKVDGAAAWTNEGKFLKSPVNLDIPDGNGLPHSVQLRARYFIGNDMVGNFSEIFTVITTP